MLKKLMLIIIVLFLTGCKPTEEKEYKIEKYTLNAEEAEVFKNIKVDDIITLNLVFKEGKYNTEEKIEVRVVSVTNDKTIIDKIKLTILATKSEMASLNKADSYYISKEEQ